MGGEVHIPKAGIPTSYQSEMSSGLPYLTMDLLPQDTICTRGLGTTAGSRLLAEYTPPYDATAVARLRDAGAILLGKTVCDAFAMGSTTENNAWQVSHFRTHLLFVSDWIYHQCQGRIDG